MTGDGGRRKGGPRGSSRPSALEAVPRTEAPLHPALEAFLRFVGELAAEKVLRKYHENEED